jgi:cytochrome c-type biogenesis protein CcmE
MAQELPISSIPAHLGTRAERRYNVKYIASGILLLLFVAFLGFQIVQATRTTGAYFMTVAELQTASASLVGQRVRVNGNVVADTEDWNAEQVTLKFSISDENGGGQTLPVVFYGPRPDNFQRAASAIVEGELQPDGSFVAESLLLKCPSRYEEEPEQIFVEATKK